MCNRSGSQELQQTGKNRLKSILSRDLSNYTVINRVLHSAVGRTAATFWTLPVDVLRWAFDVASFTVDTVLCINQKLLFTIIIRHILIDSGGTESIVNNVKHRKNLPKSSLRTIKKCQVSLFGNFVISECQMSRLIAIMTGAYEWWFSHLNFSNLTWKGNWRQQVKWQFSVRFWVFNFFELRSWLHLFMISTTMGKCPSVKVDTQSA